MMKNDHVLPAECAECSMKDPMDICNWEKYYWNSFGAFQEHLVS